MSYPKTNKYVTLAVVVGAVILLDQISKALIMGQMALNDSVTVITGFFNIVHAQNPGGAFGFLAGQGELIRRLIFVLLSAVAIGVIYYLYVRTPVVQRLPQLSLALILGGALGNMIDRLRFGRVIDFLDFYIQDLHWPAFNFADSAISIGIGLFLLQMFIQKPAKAT